MCFSLRAKRAYGRSCFRVSHRGRFRQKVREPTRVRLWAVRPVWSWSRTATAFDHPGELVANTVEKGSDGKGGDRMRPCLVCGGYDFEDVFDGKMIDRHTLGQCVACGMVQASPAGESPEFSYSEYGDYLLTDDAREIEGRVRSTGHTMRPLFKLVTERSTSPVVLDFGSGAGYLCKAAEEFGLKTFGVELSRKLAEFSMDKVGFRRVYKQVTDIGLRFDAIFMADVIEHFRPDMSRVVMTTLLAHLKPGGLLIGNTPNFGSANVRLCGYRDPVIAPPSHQCYFTLKTLDAYLSSFRLKRLRLYSRGLSSDSFFRKSKFEPSFVERRLSDTSLYLLPLVVFLRYAFRVGGALVQPWGLGYQLFFVYEKLSPVKG